MSLDTLIVVFFISLLLSIIFVGNSTYLKAIVLLEICVLMNFMYIALQVANYGDVSGTTFLFYILSIAASETSIGFALLITYYKNIGSISFSPLSRL